MKIAVNAYPRTKQGTSASRRLRISGRAPGIVYGADQPAQNIELDQPPILRLLKQEVFHASLLDLVIDNKTTQVLLRDFQNAPIPSPAVTY